MKKTTAEMIKTVTNTDIDLPEGELVTAGLLTVAQAAMNAKLTEDQFKVEMAKECF